MLLLVNQFLVVSFESSSKKVHVQHDDDTHIISQSMEDGRARVRNFTSWRHVTALWSRTTKLVGEALKALQDCTVMKMKKAVLWLAGDLVSRADNAIRLPGSA